MIFPLVANDKIRLSVENFISEKRIPHAIIIEGDTGTGKHTLANFLSKAAVCTNSDNPCDLCNNCRLVISGNHPDIKIIAPEDKKKNIAVSQIRELREEAYIKPHSAEKRVYIIDCAETMNPQSQNALLKILEEPPKTVMFILLTPNKSALLDTIVSRCVLLSLSAPEISVGLRYIKSVSKKDDSDIKTALTCSHGNIGKALSLLKGNKGSDTEIAANEYLEAMLKADSYLMLSISARFEKNRVSTDRFIKDLKYVIISKIKNDVGSVYAKPLVAFYNKMPEYEQALITNINLNLLFCSMSCYAVKLFGG